MCRLTLYLCCLCKKWSSKQDAKADSWAPRDTLPVPEDTEELVHCVCPNCRKEKMPVSSTYLLGPVFLLIR